MGKPLAWLLFQNHRFTGGYPCFKRLHKPTDADVPVSLCSERDAEQTRCGKRSTAFMPQTHCLITGQRRKMFCRAGKGSKNAPKRKKAFLNLVVFGFLQPVVNVHASAHGSRPGFFFIVRVPGIGRNRHAGYVCRARWRGCLSAGRQAVCQGRLFLLP